MSFCGRCRKCGGETWTRLTRGGPRCVCRDRRDCGFMDEPAVVAAPERESTPLKSTHRFCARLVSS